MDCYGKPAKAKLLCQIRSRLNTGKTRNINIKPTATDSNWQSKPPANVLITRYSKADCKSNIWVLHVEQDILLQIDVCDPS